MVPERESKCFVCAQSRSMRCKYYQIHTQNVKMSWIPREGEWWCDGQRKKSRRYEPELQLTEGGVCQNIMRSNQFLHRRKLHLCWVWSKSGALIESFTTKFKMCKTWITRSTCSAHCSSHISTLSASFISDSALCCPAIRQVSRT